MGEFKIRNLDPQVAAVSEVLIRRERDAWG